MDINQELTQRGVTGPEAGAIGLRYRNAGRDAIGAEISLLQQPNTLGCTITTEEAGRGSLRKDSEFLLPSSYSEVYVALFNSSSEHPIRVRPTVQISGRSFEANPINLAPFESKAVSITDILRPAQFGWPAGTVGGVTLSSDLEGPALVASGWVEDDTLGYSNMMTFGDAASVHSTVLMGTQIFLGPQENGIDIDAHVILKNTTGTSVAVAGTLAYQTSAGAVATVPLTVVPLAAGEVRDIDLSAMPEGEDIRTVATQVSVVFHYSGSEGAIMGRYVGVSSEKTYGYYSALESFAGRAVNELFWTVGRDCNRSSQWGTSERMEIQ